jgi:hypothetical protein
VQTYVKDITVGGPGLGGLGILIWAKLCGMWEGIDESVCKVPLGPRTGAPS